MSVDLKTLKNVLNVITKPSLSMENVLKPAEKDTTAILTTTVSHALNTVLNAVNQNARNAKKDISCLKIKSAYINVLKDMSRKAKNALSVRTALNANSALLRT